MRERGFTYIGLLIAIALMGVFLAELGQVWSTVRRRDREAELLWVGDQYRRALRSYYLTGGPERFPRRLEDLLADPRTPTVKRHLRQLYPDPITGRPEWGLDRTGDFITGIHSLSEAEPLKKTGFRRVDASFEDKQKYSEWIFMPQLGRAAGFGSAPGAVGKPPGAGVPPVPGGTAPGATAPATPPVGTGAPVVSR